MTNLDSGSIFETENPDVFVGMYPFWVPKRGGIGGTHERDTIAAEFQQPDSAVF